MFITCQAASLKGKIMTVSELNRETSQLLNDHFLTVQVAGEISNLSIPSSGHMYFSLKDANAQVRCAMFRNQQRRASVRPENGKQVVVAAQVSLYESRGDYQLIIEYIEEAGVGILQKAFEALKSKLIAEGLCDDTYKQNLPVLPNAIGIITSPTGAALRDILTVLKRRFPAIPVIIYPVSVQGVNAKNEITAAIKTANRLKQCDVLILGRGGGSLEDLWAFNEEIVARAIFASKIPIISGIGHETDITIADYVADFRAATPTAAAVQAVPDKQQWLVQIFHLEARINQLLQRKINQMQQSLDWVNKRLQQQHPGRKLSRNAQRIDELQSRLNYAIQSQLRHMKNIIEAKTAKFWQFNPVPAINAQKQRQNYLSNSLITITQHNLEQLSQRLSNLSQALHTVSPLATLNRGYALAVLLPSGEIIRSTEQLAVGDITETRIAHGRYTSQIKTIKPKE
jgi:exodeoxyribonuclease VII large subunit